MIIPGAALGSRYLRFQKALIFVGGGSVDVAHSRQFADVQLPVFVGGIVSQKYGGNVPFPHLRRRCS